MPLIFILQFHQHTKKNKPRHAPVHPIECLEAHLKKVVFKYVIGYEKQYSFVKYFVLNAKVLKKMELEMYGDSKSVSITNLHLLLQVEGRASQDVELEIRCKHRITKYDFAKHIHDLSMVNPFD